MGLVFPLQPARQRGLPAAASGDLAARLNLKSSSKRFTVGGTLIFIYLILLSMFLAADPLFKAMMEQGGWFDLALAGFFYVMLYVFPIAALLCWFYQESLEIVKVGEHFELSYRRSFGPVSFQKKHFAIQNLDEIRVSNWIGSRNVAAISPDPAAPEQKRYATKGHWMLIVGQPSFVLERRAKKEEIDWLKAIISNHFQ